MFILLFPIWALAISAVAILYPQSFVDLKSWIVPLLMAVMLTMGLTLSWHDFKKVWQNRLVVGLGISIQFLIMPFAAWLLSLLFGLSLELTVGMMLVGATAGGTASNVIAYLAKGDVALSVSMTLVSTLVAVALLPLLTWLYIGEAVAVPAGSMFIALLEIIVVPLLLGMLLNHWFHRYLQKVLNIFPLFSMLAILLIIGIVVALNAENLRFVAWTLALVVVLHNLIGLFSGYWLTRILGYDTQIARTVAIEVGMQNSGLSVALALQYFGSVSALPGALFSIWHNLSGVLFAAFWQSRDRSGLSESRPSSVP